MPPPAAAKEAGVDDWMRQHSATVVQPQVGTPDLVLLSKVTDTAIMEALRERHQQDQIYSYIGNVLIVVNPYRNLNNLTPHHIEFYRRAEEHQLAMDTEIPPHIFGVAGEAYQTMLQEEDNQCIIISGESGAGKTEASKHIMQYITTVSGGGGGFDNVKRIILESNPLLEAFGNAQTLRNDNSSRFGKYFELRFDQYGRPEGGMITNFLLEKSRVVGPAVGERNFHIFYQLLAGMDAKAKSLLGLDGPWQQPKDFRYLRCSKQYQIPGVDDAEHFEETVVAMKAMGMKRKEMQEVFKVLAGILHLGNVDFESDGNTGSRISSSGTARKSLEVCGDLWKIDVAALETSMTKRFVEMGRETVVVEMSPADAAAARDAVAKVVYDRLFNWLVQRVNSAMEKAGTADADPLVIGILDIYGFEVFEKNGFEQFCINYVNEKLQQLFIELTLRAEQDEYVHEGITWKPIKFFNNATVCELLEGRRPPGVFAVLDDVCATVTDRSRSDAHLQQKLQQSISHPHFRGSKDGFQVQHYAGDVSYNAHEFTEKNRDQLFLDLQRVLVGSQSRLLAFLFPADELPEPGEKQRRPTTAGFKIRQQAQLLIRRLMECTPHYVRCIKPNDQKKPRLFDMERCQHQVKYLNLKENIRVRRAGFAYRREFEHFVRRYNILCSSKKRLNGDKDVCASILEGIRDDTGTLEDGKWWQLGRTKVFLKNPEHVQLVERERQKRLDTYAERIQRQWRKYLRRRRFIQWRKAAQKVLSTAGKQRRRDSIERAFSGLYISSGAIENQFVEILSYHGERVGNVIYAERGIRLIQPSGDREHTAVPVCLLISESDLFLLEEPDVTAASSSATTATTILRRRLPLSAISSVSLSPFADRFVVLHVKRDSSESDLNPRTASEWVPNSDAKSCTGCSSSFGFRRRRHHCRLCGKLYCEPCSDYQQLLPAVVPASNDKLAGKKKEDYASAPVRVCKECYGFESCDPLDDLVLQTPYKTEIGIVLAHLTNTGRADVVSCRERVELRNGVVMSFAEGRSEGMKELEEERLTFEKGSKTLNVLSPPGLPDSFVEERLKRQRKREKEERKRRELEVQRRKELEVERQELRERERRERVKEKKKKKKERLDKIRADETAAQEKAEKIRQRRQRSNRPDPSGSGSSIASAAATESVAACGTCGCNEFKPHPFKKGQCMECFHSH